MNRRTNDQTDATSIATAATPGRRRGALGWLIVLALSGSSGCASSGRFSCPDPIGEIVRDECSVYETRYTALSVDLGFSIKGLGFSAAVEQKKLRDMSETLQVLRHQSLSVCHDYNRCRLPNADYQRRREAIDRRFTAVTAISQQLRSEKLSAAERTHLLDALIAVVSAPDGGKPAAEVAAPKARPWRDPFYRARPETIVPVPPKQRAPAVPRIVHGTQYSSGKTERLFLVLLGAQPNDIQADDRAAVFSGGEAIGSCKVSRKKARRAEGRATCDLTRPVADLDQVEVRYRPGATDGGPDEGWVSLGGLPIAPQWYVSRAFLGYNTVTDDADGSEAFERPVFAVFLPKKPRRQRVFARCTVNGKRLKRSLKAFREVKLFAVHQRAVPLPFVIKTDDGATVSPPDGEVLFDAAVHAGKWHCKVQADAYPAGTVTFNLDEGGRPKGAAAPTGAVAFVPEWFEIKREAP